MKPAAVFLLLFAPSVALADREIVIEPVCAEVEHAGTFDDAERAAAKALLARTLETENQLVVETGCATTYRVGHQEIGGELVIRISGRGGRRWTNARADQLPEIYRDMVRALLAMPSSPAPEIGLPPPPPPRPVPQVATALGTIPPAPFPIASTTASYPTPELATEHAGRGGWRIHLGVGGVRGIGSGIAIEGGHRFVRGSHAIDVFGAALGGSEGGSSKAGVELLGLHATPDGVLFGGGGLSVGQTSSTQMFAAPNVEGSGLGLELTGGIGLGPAYLQADVTLPMYQVGNAYPAAFTVSLGLGRI